MQNILTNQQIIYLAPAAGAVNPISEVSERYSFVSTLDAVDILRETGWFPVHAEQSTVRKVERDGYQRHLIRFARKGLALGGERVDLVLYNSHDRGCAFKLAASVWRQICCNGLMVASEFANFSHRHVGFDELDFAGSALQIAESAGRIATRVDDFKTIQMTPDERGVYARAVHRLVYDDPDQAPIRPERLLVERRYDDEGKDLWTTYNVCQENIMKGGLRGQKRGANGRLRRVTTRPVKAIDRNIKLNQALWVLTEEMAKLKRG